MTFKEYFKDKIDWKFYNAILDRIMIYEDAGIDCRIRVSLPVSDYWLLIVYYHNGGTTLHNEDKKAGKIVIGRYEKLGLKYSVIINNSEACSQFYKTFDSTKYSFDCNFLKETQIDYIKY